MRKTKPDQGHDQQPPHELPALDEQLTGAGLAEGGAVHVAHQAADGLDDLGHFPEGVRRGRPEAQRVARGLDLGELVGRRVSGGLILRQHRGRQDQSQQPEGDEPENGAFQRTVTSHCASLPFRNGTLKKLVPGAGRGRWGAQVPLPDGPSCAGCPRTGRALVSPGRWSLVVDIISAGGGTKSNSFGQVGHFRAASRARPSDTPYSLLALDHVGRFQVELAGARPVHEQEPLPHADVGETARPQGLAPVVVLPQLEAEQVRRLLQGDVPLVLRPLRRGCQSGRSAPFDGAVLTRPWILPRSAYTSRSGAKRLKTLMRASSWAL